MPRGDDLEARPTGSQLEFEMRVGTWLRGKWKLERLIGIGGMAGVYVARHKIGRSAAIKLLRPEIAVDEKLLERFEQEALAVNTVGHPAVVQVLDIDEDPEAGHFLVMELLDGETLADRVNREGSLKIPALLDYVDQTLDALVACHAKGIVHRDIKPENLFIQQNGKLKVLDFGIARMREGVKTIAGTMLGTVAFMPPEQLRGSPVDARADLYALGATMFTVIAGRRVHQARGDAQLAAEVLSKPAPLLASVKSDVPEHVGWVVDRALAYLPERRYPDARTMRGDVWALKRNERPPYAYACNEAGQRPDVTSLEPPPKKTRPEGAALPTTDPQMPAFASMPTTNPQMPVFAEAPEIELEPTKPERPVIDQPAESDARPSEPASRTPASEPPPSEGDALDSHAPESDAPDSHAPESDAPESDAPESDAPDSDALDSGGYRPRQPSPPVKASRTIVGFPRRDPGGSHEDDDAPASSEPEREISDEPSDEGGPADDSDRGPASDAPDAEISHDEISHDEISHDEPVDEAKRKRAAGGKASWGWWIAVGVAVALAATAGAYAGGFFP